VLREIAKALDVKLSSLFDSAWRHSGNPRLKALAQVSRMVERLEQFETEEQDAPGSSGLRRTRSKQRKAGSTVR
jgi:hypothetical protein